MASQAGPRAVAYHPAGPDTALRAVWSEVEAGRWRAMRDLLLDTRKAIPNEGWARWSQRTQVLGMLAAGSNVVEAWWAEERGVEAAVMLARVRSHRAVSAFRSLRRQGALTAQQLGDVEQLVASARDAAWVAPKWHPRDPVPLVCRLSLALADTGMAREEHRKAPPDRFMPVGPWELYQDICNLDPPHNREAAHWMFKILVARGVSPYTVAGWADSVAPDGSDVRLLPLYALAEVFKQRRFGGEDVTPGWLWSGDQPVSWVRRAYAGWFVQRDRIRPGMPGDLNVLAHALKTCGMHTEADRVFREIGPHITPSPWREVAADPAQWQEEFERARSYCARWAR